MHENGEGIDLAKHGSPEHTLKEAELATEELRRKFKSIILIIMMKKLRKT